MNPETLTEEYDKLCAILVHGIVPEFMPHCAFRRDKHYKTAGKKMIKCPYCGEDFKVVEATAKLELICYQRNASIKWHESEPCRVCHNRIGIIYVA